SLRTWSVPAEFADKPSENVGRVLDGEKRAGLHTLEGHCGFAEAVAAARNDLLEFLMGCSREGALVAGYGAPGKGNTLLNHAGVRADLLAFTVDRNPNKQGLFLPGTHIPIYEVEKIAEEKPDYVLILPWNLRDEISAELAYI